MCNFYSATPECVLIQAIVMKGVPEKNMNIWILWHDFVELELDLWAWHKKFPTEKDNNIEKKWNEYGLTCMWLRNVNEYEMWYDMSRNEKWNEKCFVKWQDDMYCEWKEKRNEMYEKKWVMQWNIGCAMKWNENGMHVIVNENEYASDMIWMCMKC